ncbi:MAG TPA: leucyl aminopeptidase [Acidimicrobiales bacterium]|nr:leucyl aminopeptidase [Acidimicrobiales bacterium]
MTLAFSTARDIPTEADVVAVPVLKGGTAPAGAAVEVDEGFLAARGFKGDVGETLPLLADDGGTILVVGVGEADKIDAEVIRRASAAAVKAAGKATTLATTLLDVVPAGVDRAGAAQALAEGTVLATYRFVQYKSESPDRPLERVVAITRAGATVDKALQRGAAVASAVWLARDLVNEPPTAMTPRRMAEMAQVIAGNAGLDLTVLDEKQIVAEGLGGLAGVAAGSDEPARLIKLVYEPSGRVSGTVAIVGKGITFDSGGLSLKSGDGMMTMKDDMGGAAAVLATMSALPAIAPKVRVIGYAACTENMPSGKATKPGDVLHIRNGKTVEVLNTDAEGRLVLADALSLAVEDGVDAIVDLATLTGACIVALGSEIAGLMSTNDDLAEQVRRAGERAGESLWPLPLPDRYRKHIDSPVADIKNIGVAGKAGTLIAGLFLKEFVGDRPWVHLDIAGPAWADADDSYIAKGGTGFGVRTLIELLSTFRAPR